MAVYERMKKKKSTSRTKWNKKEVIDRILVLQKLDEDLTYSHVKEIDSALVGAAISYFKNWGGGGKGRRVGLRRDKKIIQVQARGKSPKMDDGKGA